MLPNYVLFFWLVIVNVTAAGLFGYALVQLPKSRHRTVFLLFLLPYSIWANGLFLIQLLGATSEFSRPVSQAIFASGAFYHVLLGYLLISFASPGRERTPVFLLLACNTALVGILAPFGFWEQGVRFSPESGLAPIPTTLLWYFNVSLLVWALYYFFAVTVAFLRMKSRDLLRCQLRVLIWPAIFSMTMSLTTNVVIPALTDSYALTAIGGFWLFIFFAAIAYIIRLGKLVLLYQAVRDFESKIPIDGGFSYRELGELIMASIIRSQAVSQIRNGGEFNQIAAPASS